ncbi:MAG: RHS repeat-associated core domain-containing protein, partial [Peptococcaceae bacterium]|nr:RHS repeat-associated core domain-containing protein [Peptococcaceae bacterium]
ISSQTHIAHINPFRYRGYYFDVETGLYYLGSRYYDPVVCRFINVDKVIASPNADNPIFGANPFGYCFNNPVNISDPTGNWPRWITAAVGVVALTVAVVAVVVAAPAVATIAAIIAITAGATLLAQTIHYDYRQSKNTNLPANQQAADNAKWINSNDYDAINNPNGGGPVASLHQNTATDGPNVKYVSPDGKKEVIYDYQGNMVIDPRDIGTYNFIPSGSIWGDAGHLIFDVIPWFLYGNSDEDWGLLINIFAE